ncbi:hypothetical protein LJB99_06055 [Deltaproteobacteria bacterium OttesenSCG-928-K17]|nr:hypothetical protein [Deltaproteobacteria bacterium OttesenSCG-928-K17]
MNPFPDESRPVLEQGSDNNLFVLVATIVFLILFVFAWVSPSTSLAQPETIHKISADPDAPFPGRAG